MECFNNASDILALTISSLQMIIVMSALLTYTSKETNCENEDNYLIGYQIAVFLEGKVQYIHVVLVGFRMSNMQLYN